MFHPCRCSECHGRYNRELGYILHKSGCGTGWPEGRPVGSGVRWHRKLDPVRIATAALWWFSVGCLVVIGAAIAYCAARTGTPPGT